ncbi:endodeoxyribonuclease-like protein [Thermochaetoides thermophila DSM 1495]|uniref:Endodeoxyribonuclease-like protein n=1 Tax=Chaetomium thermophilum (strain DSM 1495 / CBS 144.50 / IMI 039719) TaxID=759272 RepID=G0RZ69_CHATD|nr:endodeoxyribonuclease-like protein [Thermochaetoides thermophila DSM 1495]EGS23497.1 endodeoxyribonuclease-like protein [Thermochaetoides thermophila DSM 1495]
MPRPSTPPRLLDETAVYIRALCSSCGLTQSGPKTLLVQRLRHAARRHKPLTSSSRILSIDLGLKNFAFCLLSPARSTKENKNHSMGALLNTPVHLHAWNRLDLTAAVQSFGARSSPLRPEPSSSPLEDIIAETQPSKKDQQEDTLPDDMFSPARLSLVTAHLVRTLLLPLRPTHVLIERQRFRTGGNAAVSEWTLRVGALEAMIHATLGTYRDILKDNQALSTAGSGKGLPTAQGSVTGGESALSLAAGLESVSSVVPKQGYLGGWEWRKMSRKEKAKKRKDGEVGENEEKWTQEKLDDLSDAVLQGLVWLQWQRNLEEIVRDWPELTEGQDTTDV